MDKITSMMVGGILGFLFIALVIAVMIGIGTVFNYCLISAIIWCFGLQFKFTWLMAFGATLLFALIRSIFRTTQIVSRG